MERVLGGGFAEGESDGRDARVSEQAKPASEVRTVLGHEKKEEAHD
jgi:hypothetical protein